MKFRVVVKKNSSIGFRPNPSRCHAENLRKFNMFTKSLLRIQGQFRGTERLYEGSQEIFVTRQEYSL